MLEAKEEMYQEVQATCNKQFLELEASFLLFVANLSTMSMKDIEKIDMQLILEKKLINFSHDKKSMNLEIYLHTFVRFYQQPDKMALFSDPLQQPSVYSMHELCLPS